MEEKIIDDAEWCQEKAKTIKNQDLESCEPKEDSSAKAWINLRKAIIFDF
jgi:hypothetical protein